MTLTVLTGEKFLAIITIIHLLLRNGLFQWGRQSDRNVNDKDRQIVHHKTLKQYFDLGLRIKKIHTGISFKGEP